MYETIKVEKKEEGKVAFVILNRPERRNAISPKMTSELLQALKELNEDHQVRVVVLTGEGDKAFSAGGDLSPDPSVSSAFLDRYENSRLFAEIFRVMEVYKKPLVARVNGDALGGGFGLVAACDIGVASENARFGTPEINVGLFPYIILATLIRVTSNPKKLLELTLTGERISADEALKLGFINYVVSQDKLDEKVNEVVLKLLKKSPAILRLGRRAYYTARELEFSKSLEFLSSMLSINTMAEDLVEGVMAFFQKREPEWKGR
jgi:enoyl-CoA hydratase/carnithine racemase